MSGQEGAKKHEAPSKAKKRKKPKFRRQESWRYKRVKENWRRPRGLDSKMRKRVKGWPPSPNKGYRSPREGRGLHPSGLREVRVMSVKDLETLDPGSDAVRIGHRVGDRKRIGIINMAREMGIRVLNPKEIEVEA